MRVLNYLSTNSLSLTTNGNSLSVVRNSYKVNLGNETLKYI